MSMKVTAKSIRKNYSKPISAGYCALQSLLCYQSPIAHTEGVYGWNFDLYVVDGRAITTGYRGMVGTRGNNEAEYEAKARAIVDDYNIPYEERKAKVNALLSEFVAQA